MAGRGKKENDIPDEAQHQQVGTQIAHKHFSVGFPRTESKLSPKSGEEWRKKIHLSFPFGFVYVSPTTCVGRLPWCAEEIWIKG